MDRKGVDDNAQKQRKRSNKGREIDGFHEIKIGEKGTKDRDQRRWNGLRDYFTTRAMELCLQLSVKGRRKVKCGGVAVPTRPNVIPVSCWKFSQLPSCLSSIDDEQQLILAST
jgi:hypothetical protein